MPHKMEKIAIYRDFTYVILFLDYGHRCGYISSEKYNDELKKDFAKHLLVHGGVTFNSLSTKYPIKSKNELMWIGFDCNHYNDRADIDSAELYFGCNNKYINVIKTIPSTGVIRIQKYVESECINMIDDAINQINKLIGKIK